MGLETPTTGAGPRQENGRGREGLARRSRAGLGVLAGAVTVAILAALALGSVERGTGDADATAATSAWRGDRGTPSAEGIKVHGDWTIDVLDPDGTLVRHVEFENALRTEGADFLVGVLGSFAANEIWEPVDTINGPTAPAPVWALFLADTGTVLPTPVPGESPCDVSRVPESLPDPGMIRTDSFLTDGCWIIELPEEAAALFAGFAPNLTQAIQEDPAGGDVFSLSGSVVATRDGQIDYVESYVWQVIFDSVLGLPVASVVDVLDFTGTGIEAIPVLTGQEIRVTFELSFQ